MPEFCVGIAAVTMVIQMTGAKKTNLVAHSEGVFITISCPEVRKRCHFADIVPLTHGTTSCGLYDLSYIGGIWRGAW